MCMDVVLSVVVVVVVDNRKWNVETESLMRTWPDLWPICRRGWSGQRSGQTHCWSCVKVFLLVW